MLELSGDGGEPKRGPGRPPGSKNKPKAATARNKVELVEGVTGLTFSFLAMMKGPHWRATKEEMADWSGDAARLFDKLEDKTVEKVLDGVAGAKVLTGLGGMFTARIAEDRRIAARNAAQRPATQPQAAKGRQDTKPSPAARSGAQGASQPQPIRPEPESDGPAPVDSAILNGILA